MILNAPNLIINQILHFQFLSFSWSVQENRDCIYGCIVYDMMALGPLLHYSLWQLSTSIMKFKRHDVDIKFSYYSGGNNGIRVLSS